MLFLVGVAKVLMAKMIRALVIVAVVAVVVDLHPVICNEYATSIHALVSIQ